MSNFIKYPKIENSYQDKHIFKSFKFEPNLYHTNWVVEHKLDGSNLQIIIDENGHRFASRNQLIGNTFQGVNLTDLIEKSGLLSKLKELFEGFHMTSLNVYGELYGSRIQKRIQYGPVNYKIIDIAVDGSMMSPEQRDLLIPDEYNIEHFLITDTLEKALEFDINTSSALIENDDLIEGVVIKPFSIASNFALKKKAEKFSENKPKSKKINKEYSIEVNELKNTFESLLNENRLLSVFSQNGEIDQASDIGKYIKLVLDDAKGDFDHNPSNFEQDENRYIFSGTGKIIVPLLHKYL